MKKRNFKGLVSPFITKSPFEGTWLAEMRYKDGEITAITMRIEKVMKYGEKRVMSIRTRESKYWVSYDKNEINLPIQSRTHYINWSIGDFGRALEWELNDNNENAKYFRFDESGSITTWDYNSSNDTFHWTHVIGGNFKVGDLVYKRFNENDLMQIKEHSRQAKYHEKLYRGRKIIYK
ncbi:MAG: hypothetical protein IJ601_08560 [Acidaminococcaceae bacterium]|nr:hypothetical protein [Acidaminococcaceae bacterium]